MSLDITPLVQPTLTVVGLVIAGWITTYVPKAIAAFEKRTGVMLTDQQRATMLGAAKTAAGILETELDKGALQIEHINVTNPVVLAQAQAAINAVSDTAAKMGATPDSIARIIVGMTDTSAHPGPVVAGLTGASSGMNQGALPVPR